jgi:hypothetical protein
VRTFLFGCGVVLLTPLAWHGVLAALGPPDTGVVIIGDSMAGRVVHLFSVLKWRD